MYFTHHPVSSQNYLLITTYFPHFSDPNSVFNMTKSILKQPSTAQGFPRVSPQEARQRETALFHADLIQQQKDIESQILFATESLLDFPPSPDSNPAHPSQKDIAVARTLLRLFQPSDLDALIEERNIDKRCGYIFCPKPNRKQETNARRRILQSKGEGKKTLKFVDRHLLERWCSDGCGKRALFVIVQLSEDPAWLRMAGHDGDIIFLEDEGDVANTDDDAILAQLQKLEIASPVDAMADALNQLAIERGDGQAHSKKVALLGVNVHENAVLQDRNLVDLKSSAEPQDSIEGYVSRFSSDNVNGLDRNKGI